MIRIRFHFPALLTATAVAGIFLFLNFRMPPGVVSHVRGPWRMLDGSPDELARPVGFPFICSGKWESDPLSIWAILFNVVAGVASSLCAAAFIEYIANKSAPVKTHLTHTESSRGTSSASSSFGRRKS